MSKYLKLFETHTNYETYINGNDAVKPNVSYCEDVKDVHFNPHTWADEYLTFVALEDGTISFDIWQTMGTDMITSISYSTDNGETWTTTENQDNKSGSIVITVNVNEGDKVLWKGDAQQFGYEDEETYQTFGSFFSSTCEFDAMGNVMSLLYGDNFVGETTIENSHCFCYLFSDLEGIKHTLVVNANNLVLPATILADVCYGSMFDSCTNLTSAPELPATTLAQYCYGGMFYNCTSLTTAPELPATTLVQSCYSSMFCSCTSLTSTPQLPATTLAESCYGNMFYDCTSLTSAPQLPATTLAEYCYDSMFKGCTSLTSAPQLPATTLANYCYNKMFNGCTNLTTAPQLSATTLANYCYSYMFQGCTGLTSAPELSATTLANGCYGSMFRDCTSLTTAPQLPATTLTQYCYQYMFRDCTSLTSAPELLATTLAQYCYQYMFQGCTNLNYIKAMFTTAPSSTYTNNWVSGVAASGTFVKNSAATWTTTGVNGVPTGWTVQTASA